ncbi:bifunctional UDP-N-acetylglucosamine diphosphorylase/glucosamine-1-phosphate N-acetyltransferase GlmU [Ferrovum sp.]|uniref:bifunctional UDP-N-acetylglucosamine diphosphorylase/glucosamine-1-phosphate N-acetyltransferase GlmU n=1 Tax=Ferrovum sp. TaxID=2609467 RepID=UPI00260CAD16|nr:bifunctional UDP-N-acetylglucosamine diphosphorylase/glucosamine-1-phosphate N-acetyltransferase GlmU [Ferrovum sp.]
MTPLYIVVLAAGQGKRMNSALPKVLQPLAAKPLLAHVLQTAQVLEPDKVIVVYGHGGEAVRASFEGRDLTWVHQAEQKGTGHALAQVLPHLPAQGIVLVLYGDVPLLQPHTLEQLIQPARDALVLLTQHIPEPGGYGRILRDDRQKVIGIREEKDASIQEKQIHEVNTGIMAMPIEHVSHWLERLTCANAQGEYYLTDIVASAVADGVVVHTAQPTHDWEALGINDKRQLARLEGIWQRHQAEVLLGSGVTIADPDRLTLRGTVTCGRDVMLDVGVILEGDVILEEGVTIGPYCVLKNCRIGAGTVVQAYTHVEGAQLGTGNHVGPYARIRPGTITQQAVHLGNFVEVKNCTIDQASKANHLTYLGDSSIGARVNVGAGTITCNYDGVNKHRTQIGDDVFIGSDTQLVAPVTVEAGATIGAGSTIVRTAPADQLTLSRSRQLTVPHWKRPFKK